MNRKQYDQKLIEVDDNIAGQKFSLTIVSDSGFNAAAIAAGYKKITRCVVSIRKASYLEIVNKTKMAQQLNVEFKPQRESYYESEKLYGLFAHLISDPEKKYMQLKWDADAKGNSIISVYVDAKLQIVATDINDTLVRSLYTKSAYTNLTVGYGRTKVMRENGINGAHISPKIENIASLKIGGLDEVVDPDLKDYLNII